MKRILLYLTALSTSLLAFSQPISLNTTNPHYFTYRGQPTVIVASGEHYGMLLNQDFDWGAYLTQMESDGLNGTRLCSGVNVEYQGWYDMPENTWAPDSLRYLSPWARSATPGYYHGGNKFDLTSWDTDYFDRLDSIVQAAATINVIVEFFFFTYVYNETLWLYNPMNTINNVNSVGDVDADEVYDVTNDLFPYQKAVVAKIVTELNNYDNIIWEVCNEPYQYPQIAAAWSDSIIKVIVDTEAALSKQHLISQNVNNFSYTIVNPNPATDVFNLHYARTGSAYTDNYDIDKALGCNETGDVTGGGEDEAQYRQECYIALTSGAAYFNNLDFSFTVGDEDGTTLPSGARGTGGPTIRAQIKLAKDFIESFDFISMEPDNTVINSVTSGTTAYCLAEAGEQYAVFIDGVAGFIQLNLPANTYTVTWIDTKTGTETSDLIRHSGDLVSIYPPTYTEDISLSIVKYTAPPVESTPKSVYLNGFMAKHIEKRVSYLEADSDTTIIPPHPDQVKVFDDTITMVYDPIETGGYGFYWWHRPDEESITEYGDMPIDNWESPVNYRNGSFTMTVEVISQPTSSPFYLQFGIWQDYGVTEYPETVADRKYISGGAGSGGSWDLGSPSTWWNKEPTDSVDFSRADDFYRIGVVLWNPSPLCIPKGTAWGTDGCPEYAYLFLPLEVKISVYASGTTTPSFNPPTNMLFSSVTTSSMRISWTDNSTTETHFELQRSLTYGSGYSTIASPTNSYYDDSGLSAGTPYYYRVRAVSATTETTWLYGNRTTLSEDPGDYTVLFEEDFDDFSITADHSATDPVGIPKASLQANFTNYLFLGSDDAENPDLADNADIVYFDGSNAIKSWYLEGQCCTGSAGDAAVADGGTGIDVVAWINASHVQEYQVAISWNEYWDPSFDNSIGIKRPGLLIDIGYPSPASRIMLNTYLTNNLAVSYYTTAYWSAWGAASYLTNARDLETPTGTWVNFTIVATAGTERGTDGVVKIWMNGIYIGYTRTSVPFRDTGDNTFTYVNLATFMGGDAATYDSPRDQWGITDDIVVWRPESTLGNDITAILQAIMPFPR